MREWRRGPWATRWRPWRWSWSAAAIAGLVVSAVSVVVGVPDRSGAVVGGGGRHPAESPGLQAAPAAAPAGPGTWVTLVTGDRVLVDAPASDGPGLDIVRVEPGPGRGDVGFHSYTEGGDTYVVPLDARPLLASGRVDEQLFDVSALVRFRYDDGSRSDLPLIVAGRDGRRTEAVLGDALAGADDTGDTGTTVTRTLASVDGVAVRQDKAEATALWDAATGASAEPLATGELTEGLTRIWLDGRVRVTLDRSVGQIGAPAAWEGGHTGAGVEVAVLDTGIDPDHPDVADAVAAARDFTLDDPDTTRDGHGHGTHVASIVTGNGQASGGRYAGVAPEARLLVGKVVDDQGEGYDSEIVAGMEWAAGEGAAVVNMSLGRMPADGTGVMDQAVDRLTQETGTLFVAAAGNFGPEPESVLSPASADAALAVGAVDDRDRVADFSSRGPRKRRFAIKPEITAPGVGIVAARAQGTGVGSVGSPVDGSYTAASGTSAAAPHVAGAAALLAGQHPGWSAEDLKAALMGSAAPQDGATLYDEGAGRVDVARAVGQPVRATPATVDAGVVAWPHGDDEPSVTPVTYHNEGDAPLTLDVAVDVRDPAGAPAAAGLAAVSPARLTVPAGGEATANVTLDTTVPGPDGRYQGQVTATGTTGDGRPVAVQTLVAVDKEVESYDLTVDVRDRNGDSTDRSWARFVPADGSALPVYVDDRGPVVVRIPKGTYALDAMIHTPADAEPEDWDISLIVEPAFQVTGAGTVVLDAREARPVGTAAADRPEARVAGARIDYGTTTASGPTGGTVYQHDLDHFFARPSATAAPPFTFSVTATLARPDRDGGFATSPYLYDLQWSENGRVPAELARSIPDRGLAIVDRLYARSSDRTTGRVDDLVDVALPGSLTTYRTPGVPWGGSFTDDPGNNEQQAWPRTYAPGHHRERWNAAPFGPPDLATWQYVVRQQNLLTVQLPLFSPQAANHVGVDDRFDTAATRLERDGELVGESPWPGAGQFLLPPDEGTYRLTARATRSSSHLSTRVEAAWTFRSGHVGTHVDVDAGAGEVRMPLLGVRFAPRLDEHNRAPSGRAFHVPVHVSRLASDGTGPVETLTVEASYDDGATWQPARVTGRGDDRVARVTHPEGDGYVSLRARATDSAGNAVEQTIIHAYALD